MRKLQMTMCIYKTRADTSFMVLYFSFIHFILLIQYIFNFPRIFQYNNPIFDGFRGNGVNSIGPDKTHEAGLKVYDPKLTKRPDLLTFSSLLNIQDIPHLL